MDVFKMFKSKRKVLQHTKTPFEIFRETTARFIILTIGAFIVAFALECFMLPNKIIDGGIIGVSMMFNFITNINLGVLIFCLNIPFIFLALTTLGKMFVIQTFYSVTMLSIATNLFIGHHVTHDSFLAAIFGGIILGVGVGLILRNSASLDGTEILSIRLSKKFSFMSIGEYLMGFNLLIYSASGFMFGWDKAMYAIITYYVASKMIDVVIDGFNSSKSVRIVSDFYKEIGKSIMKELDVSVTYMKSRGGYSGEEKILTYCVVSRLEMAKVKEIVRSIDKRAFLVVEDVHEVEGVRVRK
ncbi:MAG: YitT family protein [Candidatus Gastranaerophilales bacterium]|nr:YitT family protein [Candidatus Gastranaerophilales bacterium]